MFCLSLYCVFIAPLVRKEKLEKWCRQYEIPHEVLCKQDFRRKEEGGVRLILSPLSRQCKKLTPIVWVLHYTWRRFSFGYKHKHFNIIQKNLKEWL
jgi:hypothetical protein